MRTSVYKCNKTVYIVPRFCCVRTWYALLRHHACVRLSAHLSVSPYPHHPHGSTHGFDFNAWIADGVSFLSRADEAAIEAKLRARWVRDAAAAAEKEAAAAEAVAVAAPEGSVEAVVAKVHTARDGKTTFESLDEAQQAMILDARKKVQ